LVVGTSGKTRKKWLSKSMIEDNVTTNLDSLFLLAPTNISIWLTVNGYVIMMPLIEQTNTAMKTTSYKYLIELS
jgi:hypothetical protein